ncbi:ABC-2 type transport system permease protein [Lipingzhangella halophila]|uniref:ABC-2 type transport system permease protein n=1 Tax=Lipingzhangella halophila TaxID=1783352 RepID=A0A7W7RMY0_9ACTN|nr:ABC transporter permease [Lipingzhangella halophila]MBB4934944.1 ABC-2 type transport system permease protein [Lipingzhangella halophila]
MSTLTPARTPAGPPPAGSQLARAVASEWTKLGSVRSTWWCVAAAVAGMVVFAILMGYTMASSIDDDPAAASDQSFTRATSQGVFYLMQLAIVALAALAGAGEFTNRSITATLRWIPNRGQVLAARTLVTAVLAFVTGVAAAALAITVIGLSVGAEIGVDTGEAVRTSLGVGTCMALFAAMFVGVGTALRSIAGTIVVGFLLLLGFPLVLQLSNVQFLNDLAGYLPSLAGIEFYAAGDAGFYTAPHDGAVNVSSVIGWTAAALIIGYAELRARDA